MKMSIRFFAIAILIGGIWICLDAFYVYFQVNKTIANSIDILCYITTFLLWLWWAKHFFIKRTDASKYFLRSLLALVLWLVTLPIYMILVLTFHVAMGWSL